MKVVSVVVTYNRKDLLEECIDAIKEQSYNLDKIIIIDNNSNDGTFEMLEKKGYTKNEKFLIKRLETNIGGSGGFYEGMKIAREMDADWIWIMDDDTIPNNKALEELLSSLKIVGEDVSYLASAVYGINGCCMNYPGVSTRRDKDGHLMWHKYLKDSIVEIEGATFVSLLINGKATKKVGLPMRDYFIWGDDGEYTIRLTKYYNPAYIIGKSIVIHKRKGNGTLNLEKEENINRINCWYYFIRNNLINEKEYFGNKRMFILMLRFEYKALKCLLKPNVKYRWKKFVITNKGIFAYIFKRYDYQAFKNRFNS